MIPVWLLYTLAVFGVFAVLVIALIVAGLVWILLADWLHKRRSAKRLSDRDVVRLQAECDAWCKREGRRS